MSIPINLNHCLSFINCQLHPPGNAPHIYSEGDHPRAITLSRQSGSGAHVVAQKLAEYLQAQAPNPACPWTVFDRNLVEKVIEQHNLPHRMAQFMTEDRISEISDTMDELFGLHPSSWTLVHKMAETILHLAELGNVIVIGRGANLITRKLSYVTHVRLVGSLEKRVEYIQRLHQIGHKAALEFVHREDRGRQRFLKKYFAADVNDPLLYHLVINTDLVSYEEAARLIGMAVLAGQPSSVAAAFPSHTTD